MRTWATVPVLALTLLLAVVVVGRWGDRESASPDDAAGGWVDEARCIACHAQQVTAWQKSHHHLAMQPATDAAVLGAFDGRTLTTDVETIRFFRDERGFFIETEGADGARKAHPVAYTFGVEPLQQYLIRFNDGRLQVHGAAWDTRADRWFHLYDGQEVDSEHPLHWTGPQQNADFMCVECHTTGFRRVYEAATDSYDSQWHALGVGCQSCHGPAGEHVRSMESGTASAEGVAYGSASAASVETCARCHSRRTPLGNGATPEGELLDEYLPMLLSADLYEVDGKIHDEVFEYGSFTQSRMYAAGVGCTDCHDPHGATLRAPGDAVCIQCHNPAGSAHRKNIDTRGLRSANYDDASHHHHTEGSPGTQCVSCHMPGKLYMGNDLRHDHSFTSPNPRQALELSHSDACLGCHEGEEERVVKSFDLWYPEVKARDGGYARALHTVRSGGVGAAKALLGQLARDDLPDIRRATLLGELHRYPSLAAQKEVVAALGHGSPLVRRSAVEALGALFPAAQQASLLTHLLGDRVRAVRLAAAWQLLQLLPPPVSAKEAEARRTLIAEYEQSQNANLERAESHFNLAGIYRLTGRTERVEFALREALRRDPHFSPATVLLAQWLEQAVGDGDGAERLLEEAMERQPQDASLHHALGLMHVRQGRHAEALGSLRKAYDLAPDHPVYGHVVAVALYDSGAKDEALEVLEETSRRHPAERSLYLTRIAFLRDMGLQARAEALAAELAAKNPDDPALGRSAAAH